MARIHDDDAADDHCRADGLGRGDPLPEHQEGDHQRDDDGSRDDGRNDEVGRQGAHAADTREDVEVENLREPDAQARDASMDVGPVSTA